MALVGIDGSVQCRRAALFLRSESEEKQARINLRRRVHRPNRGGGIALMATGDDPLVMEGARVPVERQEADAVLSALRAGGPQARTLLSGVTR